MPKCIILTWLLALGKFVFSIFLGYAQHNSRVLEPANHRHRSLPCVSCHFMFVNITVVAEMIMEYQQALQVGGPSPHSPRGRLLSIDQHSCPSEVLGTDSKTLLWVTQFVKNRKQNQWPNWISCSPRSNQSCSRHAPFSPYSLLHFHIF